MRKNNWQKRQKFFFGAILLFLPTYAYCGRLENIWTFVQVVFWLGCAGFVLLIALIPVLISLEIGQKYRKPFKENPLPSETENSQEVEEDAEQLKMQIAEKRDQLARKRKRKVENP